MGKLFSSNKYDDIDEKKIFEELEKHSNSAAAEIKVKLTVFEKDLFTEVNKLIDEENIEEYKISSMQIFICYIIDLINKVGKAGEITCQKIFDLYGNTTVSFCFKYNKEENKIILTFTFYDEKLFEYLKPLIKIIKRKGYTLQNKNYEEEFKTFEIDKDSVNIYKIIIINYNK